MSTRSAGRRLRRTWPQRLLITFNAFAVVAALTSAGAIAYGKRTVGQLQRTTDLGRNILTPADELPPGEPQNFLIVGVDDDQGLAANDPVRNNRDRVTQGSVRSDTIMIVRLDPKKAEAQILSFNRDLLVKIPGEGTTRINAALSYGRGNAGLLVQTIKDNFDIDVNHYVQVNLAGFQQLVKQVGGVPIWFPTPVRDTHSGLLVENAGCTTLDQNGALAYVRSRHFQYQNAKGRWTSDGASDYGRISRQQDFVRRVIRRVISQGARNIVKMTDMVSTGVEHITLDPFTKPADLIALGRAFRSFDPDKLQTHALAVNEVTRGGAAVLELVRSKSEPTLALFRGTGATGVGSVIEPSSVTVRVINGTGTRNQASDITDLFDAAGFKVASPDSQGKVWRTEVRYPPGEDAAAVLVARYLDADPVLVPDPDVSEITVVTGPDLKTVLATPRPASAVPTTTTTTTTSTTSTTSTTRPETGAGSTSPSTSVPLAGGTGVDGRAAGYLPGDPPPGVSCG